LRIALSHARECTGLEFPMVPLLYPILLEIPLVSAPVGPTTLTKLLPRR
jgi:hypothetical protein